MQAHGSSCRLSASGVQSGLVLLLLFVSHWLPQRWLSREQRLRQGEAHPFHSLNFLLSLLLTPHPSALGGFIPLGMLDMELGTNCSCGQAHLSWAMHISRGLFFICADTEPASGAPTCFFLRYFSDVIWEQIEVRYLNFPCF